MGINVNHVHIKTQGIPGRGLQVDLHRLQLDLTTPMHTALTVDDYPGTLSKLKTNGVAMLKELPPTRGRRMCFLAATDGSQIALIEKV
jgi:hypothetical protein